MPSIHLFKDLATEQFQRISPATMAPSSHPCKDDDPEDLPTVNLGRLDGDIKRQEASRSSAVASTTEAR